MIVDLNELIPRTSNSNRLDGITPFDVLKQFREKNGFTKGKYKTVWPDGRHDLEVVMSWTAMFLREPDFVPQCNALALEHYLTAKYRNTHDIDGM